MGFSIWPGTFGNGIMTCIRITGILRQALLTRTHGGRNQASITSCAAAVGALLLSTHDVQAASMATRVTVGIFAVSDVCGLCLKKINFCRIGR